MNRPESRPSPPPEPHDAMSIFFGIVTVFGLYMVLFSLGGGWFGGGGSWVFVVMAVGVVVLPLVGIILFRRKVRRQRGWGLGLLIGWGALMVIGGGLCITLLNQF